MATGVVFIGGGIAPIIAAKLKQPGFLEVFLDKGRMRPPLESTALRIIMNPHTGLIGAARYAALRMRAVSA